MADNDLMSETSSSEEIRRLMQKDAELVKRREEMRNEGAGIHAHGAVVVERDS
jgi:hypothetical protein